MKNLGFLSLAFLPLLAACGSVTPSAAKLQTSAAPNLIQNGSFDNNGSGWNFYANTAKGVTTTHQVDQYGRYCVWVGNGGDKAWDVKLRQGSVALKKGVTYDLSFDVVTSVGKTAPFKVNVSLASSPYTAYTYTSQTAPGSPGTKKISFTMTKDDGAAQLEFHLGANPYNQYYCFDNVSLKARDGGTTPPTPTPTPAPGSGNAYGGSLAPSQAAADKVIADLYTKWKNTNLVYAPNKGLQSGEILLKSPGGQFNNGMVSEGIGYGLLLSAYNNDQATFAGIWKFAKRNLNQYGLMPWLYDSSSKVVDANNATDGDMDAALALIVASKRGWGYDQDAKTLINSILTYNVYSDNTLEMGEANNPKNVHISSYFMPGHMKVFAAFTGVDRWNKVADANYDILKKALDKPNVVVPPFAFNNSGDVVSGWDNTFNSDAGRGPFRIATDYAWYGDTRAKTLMADYNKFFEGVGLANICESYDRFGNQLGSWCGSQAGWMAASAAGSQLAENDQASRDAAWKAVTTAYTGDYYSFELTQLGVMLASGRLYNPVK